MHEGGNTKTYYTYLLGEVPEVDQAVLGGVGVLQVHSQIHKLEGEGLVVRRELLVQTTLAHEPLQSILGSAVFTNTNVVWEWGVGTGGAAWMWLLQSCGHGTHRQQSALPAQAG